MSEVRNDAPVVLFQEEQRFRQVWLWVLLLSVFSISTGTTLWVAVRQLVYGEVVGKNPMSDPALLAFTVFTLALNFGLIWLMYAARLRVEVSTAGLFVYFFPFHWRVHQIALNDVSSYGVVVYHAFAEYGGWGIRKRPRATAYNVSGDRGVRIYYANHYHYLIGSQRPRELADALEYLLGAEGRRDEA
jgi:hypothetical protein